MARFSHAACQHPSTKVARAACRRAMKKATTAPVFTNPILTAVEAAMNGPKMLTAAPVKSVSALVTRENWREHKGQGVVVHMTAGGNGMKVDEITGWSPNLLQVKIAGKTTRIPANAVENVTA